MPTTPAILRKMGEIEWYCTLSETLKDQIQLSENPLQNGVLITDHFYPKPRELTLSVSTSEPHQNPREMYQKVKDLMFSGDIMTVETRLSTFNNMMIIGVSTVTDKNTENILKLTINLKEVLLVETANVKISGVPKASYKPNTGQKTQVGSQNASGSAANGTPATQDKSKQMQGGKQRDNFLSRLGRNRQTYNGGKVQW